MADVVDADDWCRTALSRQGDSRSIETAAGKVHYLVWNSTGPRRPTLFLVHGMRGHAHWWDWIAPSFADRYKVIALDLAGMGDSGWRERYDNTTFTRDIASVIEHEGESHVTLVGHSFGGSRCVLACATRPDLFEHLIVVDSPCRVADGRRPEPQSPVGGRIYPDKQSVLERFRLVPEQPVYSSLLRAHIAEHSVGARNGGWTWKFDPELSNATTALDPTTFSRVATRTDYVYGDRSSVVSRERALFIFNAIPARRHLVCMPGGYHHLMVDQPRELIATLTTLLAG